MDYLPIFVDLKQSHCLVVGGGDIAARKANLLLKSQARVTLVAPKLSKMAQGLMPSANCHWIQAVFSENMVDKQRLVIAATDDDEVNKAVYYAAKQKGILANVADCPELCDFILPSILDRSPIVVAVSSGGQSPILARQLRARLETLIPVSYSVLGQLVGRYREAVKAALPSLTLRRRFWEKVMQGRVADDVLAGREQRAETRLKALISTAKNDDKMEQGEVYLVGAGPGDPELLTFKALRLMQQADIVFYDRLVSDEVLDLVRREADKVYVGKQRDWYAVRQDEINRLLVEHAQKGQRVLRLKGGDPFIFGRGGEEIETLATKQIPFQVVPGITASSGCASYAGIPLTHRDYSQSCIFVTGQLKNDHLDLNWSTLVHPKQTVVIYMGLRGLPLLSEQLQKHGLASDTPAALVQQGTTARQRVWVSTIADLPALAAKERPVAPTLIIIGDVVKLHQTLAWFHPSDSA